MTVENIKKFYLWALSAQIWAKMYFPPNWAASDFADYKLLVTCKKNRKI